MAERHVENRLLLGGAACLDFCNTVDAHDSDQPTEFLCDYRDVIRWSVHAGTLIPDQGERLLKLAQVQPAQADAVFRQAITLRESIHTIFRAVATPAPVPAADLATFNTILSVSLCHAIVEPSASGFIWTWRDVESLESPLWPVARSAADLLTSPLRERVRQCPGCGWLFLDQSRNRSRTWCDMRFCGNRAKARRHYERASGQ